MYPPCDRNRGWPGLLAMTDPSGSGSSGKTEPSSRRSRSATARVRVRDRGNGLARDQQALIFERFGRAAPRRKYGGLGLGLWIAREAVQAMGGSIQVQSAPGEGATFEVVLPRG